MRVEGTSEMRDGFAHGDVALGDVPVSLTRSCMTLYVLHRLPAGDPFWITLKLVL